MALSARILRVRPSPHPRQALTSALRTYHSYDHPQPPGPFNAVEEAILSASLAHVPSHGFTHAALSLGAKDVDYLDVSTNLFPKGPWSLVHYHLVNQRLALAGKTASSREEVGGKRKGVGVKVKELTWERLLANRDIIHRWQEALALMALPSNISPSLHELALLSDEIWFLAGDSSVDTSWYTKRASLSTIYASTDLFMTTDKSAEFKDTQEFLDRRFEDSFTVGGFVGSVGQWVGFTAGATINVLRSKGVMI